MKSIKPIKSICRKNVHKISDQFHIHYEQNRIWENTRWLGVPMWKLPFDAFIIQELIYRIRPNYIIETGTGKGGSALFYASICELINHGEVLTVDNQNGMIIPDCSMNILKRIRFYFGESIDPLIIDMMKDVVMNGTCLVLLDSWHSSDYVLKELELYSEFVKVNGHITGLLCELR